MRMLGSFGGSRGFGRGGIYIPPKPTIVSVTDVGTNRPFDNGALSVTVSPDPLGPTPDFYNAWAVDPQGNEFLSSGSTSNTTFTIPNLKSNVQYTVRIVAVVDFVASEIAASTTPVLVTTVPATPTIGTATDVGTNRSIDSAAATVTFTAGATGGKSITGYKVYSSDATLRGTSTSSPILAEGIDIRYQNDISFRVTAVNDNGESQVSSFTSSITLTSTPGGPSITLDSTSGTDVNFSFSVPDTGGRPVISTRVYVMSAGFELASTTISAASGSGSLTIPELTTGDAYLWSQATNSNGTGAFGLGGDAIQPSEPPTTSVSRPNQSNATITITNYNSGFTYSVDSDSGTVTRTGNTISIVGTTSSAFDVTITVNEGSFHIDRSATVTVPSSSTPADPYNVTYNCDNGTGCPSDTTHAGSYTITGSAPTRSGYSFNGYHVYCSGSFIGSYQPGAQLTCSGNLAITAQWSEDSGAPPFFPPFFPTTYNVTVDCNGGSGCPGNTTHTGSYTVEGSTPTRPQHSFDGYSVYCGTSYIGIYQPGQTISCASYLSLTAQWTATSPSQFKRCTSLQVQFGCNSTSECCSLGEGEACSSQTSGCGDFA
jgi:hypothetical protein